MNSQLNILKSNGYKLTANRKKVLEILLDNRRPLTLSDVAKICAKIDFTTIYRIMNLYVSLGIVNEVQLLDKQVHYELMGDDHHHHIICSKCGRIERIDLCVADEVNKLTDYKITNHTMEFKGLCPECQKR